MLRRDCVDIGLLAATAVTAGEGSPGDAKSPNPDHAPRGAFLRLCREGAA